MTLKQTISVHRLTLAELERKIEIQRRNREKMREITRNCKTSGEQDNAATGHRLVGKINDLIRNLNRKANAERAWIEDAYAVLEGSNVIYSQDGTAWLVVDGAICEQL